MKNIYCLSGLGADHRVFQKLHIPDAKLVHLPWVSFHKDDELGCYAQKMAASIKEENATVLGVSFGGMLATEIAKLYPTYKTIIISSAKSKDELPTMSKVLKYLIRTRLIPFKLMSKPNKITFNQFGAETEEEKAMLSAIMKDSDTEFMKWAAKAMLNWQNETVPPDIIHIHGTGDKIIKPDHITANYWIPDGSHLMIYNRADAISRLIAKHI